MRLIKTTLFVILISVSVTRTNAQFEFIEYSNNTLAFMQKIDSMDTFKGMLNNYKQQFHGDTAIRLLDTTKRYQLKFSDTIKFDKSDRLWSYRMLNPLDSSQQMNSSHPFLYTSNTVHYDSIYYSGLEITQWLNVRSMYLTPQDSIGYLLDPTDQKTYIDYYTPSLYHGKYLVLTKHHGYYGHNSMGVVNFSNTVSHYFEVVQ